MLKDPSAALNRRPGSPCVTNDAPVAMEPVEGLVDRARDGDGDAFSQLFERFHDEVYRFAARRLRDHVAAQDVAAETFANAFAAIGRFRWRGAPFEAWLYQIARRRVADAQRRDRHRARDEAPEGAVRDHAAGVASDLALRERIAALPAVEREVIELRFMEDLDVQQTARRLGKRPGAVRVAQHRAIKKLRAVMEQDR